MQRFYPAGVIASHTFGYTKEISPEQLSIEKDFYILADQEPYIASYINWNRKLSMMGFNPSLFDSLP